VCRLSSRTDDAVPQRGEPADAHHVEDVRVLVREERAVPVVHFAKWRELVGRHGVEADEIVGERRRRAVRRVAVVGDHDVDRVARIARELRHELPVHVLGDSCDALGDAFFARVIMHAEVLGRLRTPLEARVSGGARGRRGEGAREEASDDDCVKYTKPARGRHAFAGFGRAHAAQRSSWKSGSRFFT
jgi:hypothetical protein